MIIVGVEKASFSMNDKDSRLGHLCRPGYREDWADGFWICFCFGMASLVAFTLPAFVLKRLARSIRGSGAESWTISIGGLLILLIGPIILSKVYRALEYPGSLKQQRIWRMAANSGSEDPEPSSR